MTDIGKAIDLCRRRNKILGREKRIPAPFRVWSDAGMLLKKAGKYAWFGTVITLSVILPALGIFISSVMGNPYLNPVAVMIGVYSPPLFVLSRQGYIIRRTNDSVKKAVGLISNTYISTEDMIRAFNDNLPMLDEPVKTPCAEFVAEASFIQAHIPTALNHLKKKLDSRSFRDWCDVLIECDGNKDLKYVLPVISERINDTAAVQAEIDTILDRESSQFKEIGIIALLLCAALPLLQPVWWHDLITNTFGQIFVAAAVLIAFSAVAAKVHITRPVYYERRR